jgi:flagellar biosynthetic protein FliO
MEPMAAVVVVLGLLIGLRWLVRRPTLGRGGSEERYLSVLDTASITPGQNLALVRVAGRCLLIGASNGHIEKLAEFPTADLPALGGRRESGHMDLRRRHLLTDPIAMWLGRLRSGSTSAAGSAQ